MKTRQLVKLSSIHCIMPLLAGLTIYLFLRQHTWLNSFKTWQTVPAIDHSLGLEILKYHVPDFCWNYSLASAVNIYKLALKKTGNLLNALVFILLLMSEGVQYFFPSSFTFDVWDICAAIFAFLMSYVLLIVPHEKTRL